MPWLVIECPEPEDLRFFTVSEGQDTQSAVLVTRRDLIDLLWTLERREAAAECAALVARLFPVEKKRQAKRRSPRAVRGAKGRFAAGAAK
jgi:hypothetical protein